MQKIKTDGKRLIDETGRERIFHGINMVFKGALDENTGKKSYIPDWDKDTISWLRESGFNLIRLGMIWDAVEPSPGELNGEYIDWIDSIISMCEKNGIYVFLDMHQDLFSEKYSDGAPAWATLDEGLDHYTGDVWSDSYLFSDAVKRSFDNFWANADFGNGQGILDHYVELWASLAKMFSRHNNLIGFDCLNEPYPGSSGIEVFGMLLEAYGKLTGKELSIEQLMGLFANEEEKLRLLQEIDDYEIYSSMADAARPALMEFDETILSGFYQMLRDKIRKQTDAGAIFMENSYFSNMGIECSLKRIKNEDSQVYSPHGYDLVVDSPAVCIASNKRVDAIFDSHRKVQERLDVPVIVGEWGAHGKYAEGLYHIRHILGIFDKNKWSHTYWTYFDGIDKAPVFSILKRPYPQAISGRIDKYGYDYEKGVFNLEWEGKGAGSVIYSPSVPIKIDTKCVYIIEALPGGASLLKLMNSNYGKHRVLIGLQN